MKINGYEIKEKISESSYCEVFRAADTDNNNVIIKMMKNTF